MGFKSIPSGEVLGRASLTVGEAPKHVPEDHLTCAFYPQEPIGNHQRPLTCPHGVIADMPTAWYNEDYIRRLKELTYRMISHMEILDKNKKGPLNGEFDQFEPFYEFQSLTARHWDREVMQGWVQELRELTK